MRKATAAILGCAVFASFVCTPPVSAAVIEDIAVEEANSLETEDVIIQEEMVSAAEERKNVSVDEAHFPDNAFRSYVSAEFDKNQDGILSESEIQSVTSMNLWDDQITNLEGIGYFTMLTNLRMKSKASACDLSANEKLETLQIIECQMTSLDLSKCRNLQVVNVSSGSEYEHEWNLTGVIWPEENHIQKMRFSNIRLADQIFSEFPYLTDLEMERPEIDLACFPNLEKLLLTAFENEGVAECPPLDVSKNPNLKRLESMYAIPPCDTLDFSHNQKLERVSINASDNHDQSNRIDWAGKTCEVVLNQNLNLTNLSLYNIPVSQIHLEGCPNLQYLVVKYYEDWNKAYPDEKITAPLSQLELSKCPELKGLVLAYTNVRDIDFSNNKKLEELMIDQDASSFLKLDNQTLKLCIITFYQTLKINKNHYYDLSKIAGYRKGMMKSVSRATLKGDRLYPTATEVQCKFYLDSAKKYVGTVIFEIEGQLAPQPMTGLTLKKRTATSLTFQWKKAADADGYRVYLKNKKTGVIEQRKSVSKTKNSFTFSGLKPATQYTIIVRGYKSYYESYITSIKDKKNYYSSYGQSSNTRTFTTLSRK